ncbi:mesoderm-specific transcript protein-like, partial [Tropilaelaps mercedesae]
MFPGGNLLGGVAVLAVALAIFQAQPAPPQSPLLYQWETVNGKRTLFEKKHKIFYKDIQGRVNNSEIVLILHGFPTSSFDFYLMIKSLRNTFQRIILPDFLGFGYSDK